MLNRFLKNSNSKMTMRRFVANRRFASATIRVSTHRSVATPTRSVIVTDESGHPRPSRLRSPFIPLVFLAVQQILHRRGFNQWLSFPFHLLALCWVGHVAKTARHLLSRIGGWVAVAGGTMNAVVIAATNGMMPIDPVVWHTLFAGPLMNKERMHVARSSGWRHFLGDRFAVSHPAMVVSLGDFILFAGGLIALVGLSLAFNARRISSRSTS